MKRIKAQSSENDSGEKQIDQQHQWVLVLWVQQAPCWDFHLHSTGSFVCTGVIPDLYIIQPVKCLDSCLVFLPFSMKSMTVKELQFKLLQLPPSVRDVCRLEESFRPSFNEKELSPSLAFFVLLLFFFEDMIIAKSFSTWKQKHV